MLVDIDVVEHRERIGVGHFQARGSYPGADLVGLGRYAREEVLLRQARPNQVLLDPLDRVLELPRLEFGRQAIPGRVVRCGVGAHPVGVRLDQPRTLSFPGRLHGLAGYRQAWEDLAAIPYQATESKAAQPAGIRGPSAAVPAPRL